MPISHFSLQLSVVATHWQRLLVGFCFLICFLSVQTVAQSTNAFQGTIVDEQGDPLPFCTVRLVGQQKGSDRHTTTTANGEFTITAVDDGIYTLTATRVGFYPETISVTLPTPTTAQPVRIVLREQSLATSEVVVTATRSVRELSTSPTSATVVTAREMRSQGARLLGDVLAEQPGLAIINDHGQGVQMQGLDPAYTLILIDGEPAIGRTAGTLSLDRFMVGDLERVEIVKGPFSSLYGSEALAGVINLISRRPGRVPQLSGSAEYGTNGRKNFTLNGEGKIGEVGVRFFGGYLGSDGYDLHPATLSPTVAPFNNYSLSALAATPLTSAIDLSISGKFSAERSSSQADLVFGSDTVLFDDRGALDEFNVSGKIGYAVSSVLRLQGSFYATRYATESILTSPTDTAFANYYRSIFDQGLTKGEVVAEWSPNEEHYLTVGGGVAAESVEAELIAGGVRTATNAHLLAQHQWQPNAEFGLVAGLRFDSHSDYAAHLSPRLSLLYKPIEWGTVRLSAGSGFKAPTSQQLYLDFTNPTVGYSAFGSVGLLQAVNRLRDEGKIQQMLRDVEGNTVLRPESSVALGIGFQAVPHPDLRLTLDLFHNRIHDLIEATAFAVKTNGQYAFSYFNLERVVTQGASAEARWEPLVGMTLAASYQFLDCFSLEEQESIARGEVQKVGTTGVVRAVQAVEYGGLFNRSRHSGTLRISYNDTATGITATLRTALRGRYGYADANSNGVLDDAAEYHTGYMLWNASVSKQLGSWLTAFATAENLLDHTDSQLPELPGRLLGLGIRVEFR